MKLRSLSILISWVFLCFLYNWGFYHARNRRHISKTGIEILEEMIKFFIRQTSKNVCFSSTAGWFFFQSYRASTLRAFFVRLSSYSLMLNMISTPFFLFYSFLLLFQLGFMLYFLLLLTNMQLWSCIYK